MDALYTLRSWRRAPGPIAAALASLVLGLGATVAIFSVVSGVLLRPLPYQNPERLVMVWQDLRPRGGPAKDWISPGLFVEWRQRGTMFERLAPLPGWGAHPTRGGETGPLRGGARAGRHLPPPRLAAARGRAAAHPRRP